MFDPDKMSHRTFAIEGGSFAPKGKFKLGQGFEIRLQHKTLNCVLHEVTGRLSQTKCHIEHLPPKEN